MAEYGGVYDFGKDQKGIIWKLSVGCRKDDAMLFEISYLKCIFIN